MQSKWCRDCGKGFCERNGCDLLVHREALSKHERVQYSDKLAAAGGAGSAPTMNRAQQAAAPPPPQAPQQPAAPTPRQVPPAATPKSAGPVCAICDEPTAVVSCENCKAVYCAADDVEVHKPN